MIRVVFQKWNKIVGQVLLICAEVPATSADSHCQSLIVRQLVVIRSFSLHLDRVLDGVLVDSKSRGGEKDALYSIG